MSYHESSWLSYIFLKTKITGLLSMHLSFNTRILKPFWFIWFPSMSVWVFLFLSISVSKSLLLHSLLARLQIFKSIYIFVQNYFVHIMCKICKFDFSLYVVFFSLYKFFLVILVKCFTPPILNCSDQI